MAKASPKPQILFTDSRDFQPSDNVIRPVWCAKHHFSGPWPCECPPGPGIIALNCPVDEIFYGGQRGGMKSETALIWLASGNPPGWESGLPVDISYLNSKHYRALILRDTLKDLEAFLDRADALYTRMGAHVTYSPSYTIEWPSGAKFIAGYLESDRDVRKYLGPEYHRIVFEQVEQVRNEDTYKKLFGSMRSTTPGLHCQVFLTANPGSGPGQGWLKARFMETIQPNGEQTVPMQVWKNPETGRTRIFIPAGVRDNPYLTKCPECGIPNCGVAGHRIPDYIANLMEQPEHIRKAWLEGDWDSLAGTFFPEFREKKYEGEADNALHVVPTAAMGLKPWWNRLMAMDWGYTHPSVVGWGAQNPHTNQLNVYRELAFAQLTPNQAGAMIAKASIEDLRGLPDKVMVMALSHDAFGHKDEDRSIADQIREGVENVLGPKSSFVMDFTQDEKTLDYEQAWSSMLKRRDELRGDLKLIIIPCNPNRVAGWGKVRDMLRWKPLQDVSSNIPDPVRAQEIMRVRGTIGYLEYLKQFESAREVLPQMLISEDCREIRRSLKTLIFATGAKEGTGDAEKMDGDDPADMLRYLCQAYEPSRTKIPEGYYVAQQMDELRKQTGLLSDTSLINASIHFHEEFKKKQHKPLAFTPIRAGAGRRRTIAQLAAVTR